MTVPWKLDAVLLDMDGTLLDTERVYLASLTSTLTTFGYHDADELCHAMIGIPGAECEAMLLTRYGEGFPLAEINKAYAMKRDEMFEAGLPLKTGTLALLDALRDAGWPMAIVTSSSRRTADQHLSLAGIRDRFTTVITRDDVARGKPSPDLYLLAAATLGVTPAACVAVEDSTPGIDSAHSAGVIPIMVPDIVQPSAETRAKCAAVVPDLHVTLAMLREKAGLGR